MTTQLENEINTRSQEIATDAYAMSIGEIISLYQNAELDIHPEFQRFFRWTDTQKSNFVESILLGIPIPSLFVSQRSTGVWELVDGLQRVSTILQLTGELKDKEGQKVKPLVLEKTEYLPSLEGMSWSGMKPEATIPTSAKLKIRRSRLDIKIVLNTSDDKAKFELFRRLNTGGSFATDQEVRNCLLLMSNNKFFDWFASLGKYENFRKCLPLTERAIEESYDYELLTRYLVLKDEDPSILGSVADLSQFLTEKILDISQDTSFQYLEERSKFESTFNFLAEQLGEDAFRRYDQQKQKYTGPMLVSIFEVVALGIGHCVGLIDIKNPSFDFNSIHQELWSKANMQSSTGSGVSASSRIPRTLELGRSLFK